MVPLLLGLVLLLLLLPCQLPLAPPFRRVQLRYRSILSIEYVVDSAFDTEFCPHISFTPTIRPWRECRRPLPSLPHVARCICLQRIQYQFRPDQRGHYDVYMVSSCVDSLQSPFTHIARFPNRLFDRVPLFRIENYGSMVKPMIVVIEARLVGREVRRSILIMKSVNRSTLVTMQPCSVATERDQISEWPIVVHRGSIRNHLR